MKTTKEEMIESHLRARGITNPRVLEAMRTVDRTLFVPDEMREMAYEDQALPIGMEQTISQPYIVGYMAQALQLNPEAVVLEVGTGCGYNAAILAHLVKQVYSIEVIGWLVDLARENLSKLQIRNIVTRHGDGYEGCPDKAPFDAIILTAAPPFIPDTLKQQLKIGGKLLAPVGTGNQNLVLLERARPDLFKERNLLPVKFVPMTGEVQKQN